MPPEIWPAIRIELLDTGLRLLGAAVLVMLSFEIAYMVMVTMFVTRRNRPGGKSGQEHD